MKKLLTITLFLSCFSTFAFDDGSDKIIKKYLKAIGGVKEWEAVKTIKTTMHEENRHLGESITTIFILRDKGYKSEKIYEFSNKETKNFQGGAPSISAWYHDETAWRVANFGVKVGDKKIDSLLITNNKKFGFNQVVDMSNNKSFVQIHKWQTQMPWNFIDYGAKGYKATYKGDSKISVDEVSEIEMVAPTGDTARYFFNKKSYFLLKAIYQNQEFVYSNYKQVNEVKIPFEVTDILIDFHAKGSSYSKWYIIDQVKLNEPMDEKIFMKPKQ